jgi:hypothetical protein
MFYLIFLFISVYSFPSDFPIRKSFSNNGFNVEQYLFINRYKICNKKFNNFGQKVFPIIKVLSKFFGKNKYDIRWFKDYEGICALSGSYLDVKIKKNKGERFYSFNLDNIENRELGVFNIVHEDLLKKEESGEIKFLKKTHFVFIDNYYTKYKTSEWVINFIRRTFYINSVEFYGTNIFIDRINKGYKNNIYYHKTSNFI